MAKAKGTARPNAAKAEAGVGVEVGEEVEVRLVFWFLGFWVFSLFPNIRRGSGGALGDEVTRVQWETGEPMNWKKGRNRDRGLAYGACKLM
jgi:hypothetical protein